ncbi:MAG: hypothetical protein OXC46_09955 [Thaumarchaeota archaeon]|nr:hypothetical protein [Nitrososphaerota archaeon]
MPLNISDSNKIFRKSIIGGFFEPCLLDLDFKKSPVRHPVIPDEGLMQSDLLHVFFDVETGSDYPDADEWFIVEFLFPHDVKIPDSLKGADYFTTITTKDRKTFWHHRELIRYKHGKSKKLQDALDFLESKYKDLHGMLEPIQKDIN